MADQERDDSHCKSNPLYSREQPLFKVGLWARRGGFKRSKDRKAVWEAGKLEIASVARRDVKEWE